MNGNPRILSGHFKSTRERIAAAKGPVLVLHDTTEFTYQRERPDLIGMIKRIPKSNSRRLDGKPQTYTTCGILMHSSLAVTLEGLPLGLSAVKFWTRKKFRGVAALRREVNLTRIPIETKESIRWLENLKQSTELFEEPSQCIHIGDREADIYELFCAAQEVGTHFLVRTCVNRLAGDGDHTVATIMDEVVVKGLHRIEVQDSKGNPDQAVLEIRYRKIRILPPIGKQSRYPALTLTVIHADERGAPKNRKKIEWKLLTDLPVQSRGDAIEKLEWYSLRWKIEVFHKILKSGCRAEDSQLRTAQRLTNLISVFCIVSWRIFWMTMLNRAAPNASPEFVLTKAEIQLLDRLVKDKKPVSTQRKTLSQYLIKIARLGGYLARANDPPPGNLIMWRGLSRFIDIATGATL
ncbi:IS4 family transposase [Bradyrhizobium sp. B120]|uniref:IS4 family transposase n=1 Tax=Bradyrhizobium sp. B120 TaxID=3410088 RepID=UPI003B98171E